MRVNKLLFGIALTALFIGGVYFYNVLKASAAPPITANLVLHYDASAITGLSDGDPVNTWVDSSGNGWDATKELFNAPTYETNELNGLPIVRFNAASTQALRGTYTQVGGGNAPWTMFAVGRLTGGANQRLVGAIYPDNQNWLLGWWNGNENVAYYAGFVSDGGQGIAPTTNWRIYTGKGDANIPQGTLYTTDTTTGATTIWQQNAGGSANPNGGIALSGYASLGVPSELSNGEIAEVILYNGAMSDADRHAVETYLYNRWFVLPPSNTGVGQFLGGGMQLLISSGRAEFRN